MGTKATDYKREYNKNAYDRIELKVKKGEKDVIKAYADSKGETVNGFINRAINEAMGKEGQNDE
ncbi:MAG: DUF1778 domain-containing protein [Ruminococcus sp.]|jgi:uncharacterized protein (DUF1778 family)|nr:DUF1778 domain-containing protein [Ruminococcus sp.]